VLRRDRALLGKLFQPCRVAAICAGKLSSAYLRRVCRLALETSAIASVGATHGARTEAGFMPPPHSTPRRPASSACRRPVSSPELPPMTAKLSLSGSSPSVRRFGGETSHFDAFDEDGFLRTGDGWPGAEPEISKPAFPLRRTPAAEL